MKKQKALIFVLSVVALVLAFFVVKYSIIAISELIKPDSNKNPISQEFSTERTTTRGEANSSQTSTKEADIESSLESNQASNIENSTNETSSEQITNGGDLDDAVEVSTKDYEIEIDEHQDIDGF